MLEIPEIILTTIQPMKRWRYFSLVGSLPLGVALCSIT